MMLSIFTQYPLSTYHGQVIKVTVIKGIVWAPRILKNNPLTICSVHANLCLYIAFSMALHTISESRKGTSKKCNYTLRNSYNICEVLNFIQFVIVTIKIIFI